MLGKTVFALLYTLPSEDKTGIVQRKGLLNRQDIMLEEMSMWACAKTETMMMSVSVL